MKYMLLIYENEANYDGEAGEKLLADIIAGHHAFTEELIASGIDWSGSELAPTFTAATVAKDGVVHDGPFAETKEVLAGFNLIEADSLEDAVRIAHEFPWTRFGSIEVRPVRDFDAVRRSVGA